MQVEASAYASPGSISHIRHTWNRLMGRAAFQEPVIDVMKRKSWKSAVLGFCAFGASISALGPGLVAQNVVISTNSTWATGSYNLTSLSVVNGATLTVGGGSTVTVSGAVLVTANSNLVLQSINNASQVNGSWQGAGVTVNAGSVQVDPGSTINADGQGYLASAGPGGAATGSSAGGSYGGLGGSGYGPTPAGPIYGSNTMPTDLGSGGGTRCCGAIAGTGGGAIRLIVSGTLTDNGVISANGANLVGYQGGGGSGGSLWVTTAGLAGSGVLTANGGTGGEAAGGGGRIAIYYNGPTSSFTGFTTSTSSGGSCGSQCSNGTPSAGSNGTAAFFDTSATNTNLMVDQDLTIPANSTVSYNSITVQPGAVLTIGGGSTVTVANSIAVSGTVVAQSINNSAQVNGSWQGSGVTLHAASVVVNTGGSINADGQGYLANSGPGGAPAGSSTGGSYGGLGGAGYGSAAAAPIYGSTTAPTDLGSGGSTRCCGTIPGVGGGSITITVSGTLTDNGIISANGGDGSGLQVGGGSGGTVSIQMGTLTGSGSVAANGGIGGEAGGGGGRVALYYNVNSGFNTALVTSNGGTSSNGNPGATGTVYTLGAGSNLTVSNNTTLPANANLSFSSVTINNGATLTVGSGTTLASNTVTVSAGGNFTVGGGSTLNISGAVLVTGNSNIVLQSINNAAQVNGSWQGVGVTLNAASVQVDPGSSINANGQGYLASAGPGGAQAGSSTGGSYGGLGGLGNGPSPAAPIYGSNTMPTDLGSGGGSRCCGAIAGPGGGAIRLIVSGSLTNNGVISANGANLVGYQGGGGSGGSVWVTTAALTGSGAFTANGGTGGEAAGGGGRIAVYYNGPTSSFTGFTTSTSNGGSCGNQCSNGTASAGGTGTAAFFDTSVANSNLMVDQDLTIPAGTTVSYNSITVQPNATLTIGGGSTVTVAGSLTVSGTLVAQSINNTSLVNGTWQGAGVNIQAASVVVNTGGSIDADAQGYVSNAGPGGAPAGSSTGGSYGGLGGAGNGPTAAAPVYGSTTAPTDLGSGGSSRCCGTIPGAGGGAINLMVSGTLIDNGIISANGGNGAGLQVGGGSGGTLAIQTATLAGSGVITASGGAGGEAGGGGGRIALGYNTNSGFNIALATAAGGTSSNGNAGASGTVYALGAGTNLTVSFNTVLPANANLTYTSVMVNNQGTLTLGSGTTMGVGTVTVSGGSTFTVGGGSTVNVSGAMLITGNSNLVLQSINNALQVNSAWQGLGVTVNAGSVQVDPGSSINADGQGYLANAGPGGAPVGSSAGGSYGGLGGSGNGPTPAAPIYGSNTMPTDLGSGGGSRCCGAIAGTGGGAVRLIVSGTLTDNGVISANGANLVGYQGGGGSGGSVWITTGALVGSGVFTSNGGTGGEAAGGGGRIAVYYNAQTSNFTGFTTSTSNGGSCGSQCSNGTASTGGTGTAAFFDTSATNTNLMVDQDLTIPAGTSVSYNSITVQPGAVLTIGGGSTVTVANLLTVSGTVVAQSINNTNLLNGTWQGTGVTINAAAVVVNTNASINADGQGYVPNAGPGGAPAGSSSGGSYGGLGGSGYGPTLAAPIYGSATLPVDLGSGGGLRCCSVSAGAGGGALLFNVSGTLTNNGIISANGAAIVGYQAGGGSGGTVYVNTAGLSGSGVFTANGGLGGEAGGGGGRVAVYYNGPSSNFTGFSASTASSGGCGTQCSNGTASAGSNGTAAFFDTSAANNNLSIYQNFTIPAGASPTYNSVTVQTGALLTIGGGATLTVINSLTVSGTAVAQSVNSTAQVGGAWVGSGVSINAGSITVNGNGSLNADAQGYVAGAGPGGSPAGTSAGGSYGGLGGVGSGSAPSPTYGSLTLPVDLGSGGNTRCCGTVPGAGGGALILAVSGTLTDNGVISANGGTASGLQVGGGSGGSVSIHTAALTGSGNIAANGGLGGEAGGGGGRVALYFNTANGFNLALATASGGVASSGNAGAVGTVYIPGLAQTITFPPIPNHTVGDPPFSLSATSSSGLAVTYAITSGPATVSGSIVTLTGAGTVVIQANQPGNAVYASASPVSQSFLVALQSQTITFTPIPNHAAGDPPFAINATASSGLGVTFAVIAGPAKVSGNTVALTGVGSVTIQATQAGNTTYAAATPVSQSFTISPPSQTITFPPIPNHTTTDPAFLISATSSSGLPVTFALTSGPATISGTAVTVTGVGTVVITASQAGNANYSAATPVSQSFTVSLATQTITFPTIPNQGNGGAPFALGATASSGLQVTYTVTSGPATVLGNTVTLTGAGTVVIQAAQAGNTTYAAATPVSQSFVVLAGTTLASITPSSGVLNASATTITLTGSGFVSTDVVQLNGATLASTYVSATTLTAIIPASFFTSASTGQVTVVDPTGRATTGQTFTVGMAPAINFSGPATTTSAAQPTLTFQLVNPYPLPISGVLTLTFNAAGANGVDDPAVQFSTGGRTMAFSIPALSTLTPTVQIQTGTVAGTATITLVATSNGMNVTPANVTPVQITIAPAAPMITTSAITRSGNSLSVTVDGFSNTRDLSMAIFHFTPVPGSTISTPDITAPVGSTFSTYFSSAISNGYGSTFIYTQSFQLNNDASSIQSVTVTLVNMQGNSMASTVQ